jgi:molybdate transport system permease protein
LLSKGNPLGARTAALGIEIVFTWKAVLLATMVMSLPLLVRSARTAFEEVDPRLGRHRADASAAGRWRPSSA